MEPLILDGKQVAADMRVEMAEEIQQLQADHNLTPGLAVVLVGDNPASVSYVTGKQKACEEIGIYSQEHRLSADYPESDLLTLVEQLNQDPAIHGILVQLPLPKHIDEAQVLLDDWQLRYAVPCRIKEDRQVTREDVEQLNLVLLGGPDVNAVTAKVMPDLPVRVGGGRVVVGDRAFDGDDVGMKVIYPNPLNPQRYVVVFAATTWRGMYQIAKRFGNWFGWRTYEKRDWYDFVVFDDVSRGPASFLVSGFFDRRWRLAPALTYSGDTAWRAGIPRRTVPVLVEPSPNQPETFLSDLVPAGVFIRMGALGLDRSFRGNVLRPGGRACDRGLGMRVGGGVVYALDGRCDRFRAVVGVDNEGEEPTRERRAVTRVGFEVWGDGRLLAASSAHRWDDPPERMDVDVRDVTHLDLRVISMGGRSWVYGSVAWGNARVSLAETPAISRRGALSTFRARAFHVPRPRTRRLPVLRSPRR